MIGEWAGELRAPNGAHRFRLSIDANRHLTGRLDDHPRSEILVTEWREQELRGTILADIGLDDLRQPYRLRFQLTPTDNDRLAGPIAAWSFRAGRGADILPAYAILHRERTP